MADLYKDLVKAVKKHGGLDDQELMDAAEHGADSGWGGFTYYKDTTEFYDKNEELIWELLEGQADEVAWPGIPSPDRLDLVHVLDLPLHLRNDAERTLEAAAPLAEADRLRPGRVDRVVLILRVDPDVRQLQVEVPAGSADDGLREGDFELLRQWARLLEDRAGDDDGVLRDPGRRRVGLLARLDRLKLHVEALRPVVRRTLHQGEVRDLPVELDQQSLHCNLTLGRLPT